MMKPLPLPLALPLILLTLFAGPALAIDEITDGPLPRDCADGMLWAEAAADCVALADARLDDSARYVAAKARALDGQHVAALAILATAQDPSAPRILTYQGYCSRKLGRFAGALAFYEAALAADPDYHEARSYLGETLLEMGDADAALAQLHEIRTRGGRETWAYMALKQALSGKPGY